jgi:ferredoxin
MKVRTIQLAYFSPTHTTQRTLRAIAEGVLDDSSGAPATTPVIEIDLTLPEKAKTVGAENIIIGTEDLVLIGAPVYAGRLPRTAVARLQRLRGKETPAVLVVVYGNRAFEDALLELKDLIEGQGFVPVAGGAFIGEHSYHKPATPIAPGRPDARDLAAARAFGARIRAEIAALEEPAAAPPLQVPGSRPYRTRGEPSESAPTTDPATCTLCGACAEVCPTGAVEVTDVVTTDGLACILCCACTRACPTGARMMDVDHVLRIAQWLSAEHGARKEPEVYLAGGD